MVFLMCWVMQSNQLISNEYKSWISELKQKFQQAQVKASVKVNNTLLEFYWELGADIVEKQKDATWGTGFLKQVSADLMKEFPDVKGFSHNNLKHIRNWWKFYNNKRITSCYPIENDENSNVEEIEAELMKGVRDER